MAANARRAIIAISELESREAKWFNTVGSYRIAISGHYSGEKTNDLTITGDQLFRIADILSENE